ncbi:MAG: ABC transporter ATP-binding protein [Planctomycetota bacterium]
MTSEGNASSAIRAEGLCVRYGKFEALSELNLDFRGPSLGLLGPNGAGKSTFIKTLLGLIRPNAGRASVLGLDSRRQRLALRRSVGYVPEKDCHIPEMSAVDYVTLGGELAGMPRSDAIQRAHEMLQFCGVGEARYRAVDDYSAGMRQRTKLAQALVHDPKLVFLDEPTNGLDPEGRLKLLSVLRDLQENKGIRIVLSSHLLRDVEFVCEEVMVLRRGRLVVHGNVLELKQLSDRHLLVKARGDIAVFQRALEGKGCQFEDDGKQSYRVIVPSGCGSELILETALENDIQIRHLKREESSLEEAFLSALDGEANRHAGL